MNAPGNISSPSPPAASGNPPRAGTSREEFLAGVRAALGRSALHAPPPPTLAQAAPAKQLPAHADAAATDSSAPPVIPDALLRLVRPDDHLATIFTERARRVGMRVQPTTLPDLPRVLADVLRAASPGGGRVALSIGDDSLAHIAAEAMRRAERSHCAWRDSPGLDALYDAAVGVTDVAAAIAETGSLVISSGRSLSRGAFLVPPVHVAIVRATQIVPDLIDYFAPGPGSVPASEPLPTSLVLVTGPSKTADIEGILVTGVHGPREVVVVLVEE